MARGDTIDADWESCQEREDRLKRECEERGETYYQESDWDMAERHAEDIRRAHDKAKIRKEKEAKAEKEAAAEREAAERWEREHQGMRPSRTAPRIPAPRQPAPRLPLAAIAKKELVANWQGDTGNEWKSSCSTTWNQMDWQSDWQTQWEQQQEGWNNRNREEDEADRSERRSRDSKERDGKKDYDLKEEALRERERIRIQGNQRFEEIQRRKKEKEDRRDRR